MATSRKPRTTISAVTIYNSYNTDDGSWIPSTITIGSWVLLQRRKRKRRNANEFAEPFKGQVKEFKYCMSSKRVTEVLIQHVFQHADLRLKELPSSLPRYRPNYIYPSNRVDWQPVESISGIFDAFHAFVGEQLYKGRNHRDLANNGIYFYDMHYIEPSQSSTWGRLTPIPLPSFESRDWPLPTAQTSESYRIKLYQDIQKALKASIATKNVRLSIFMPIEVFVDFFLDEEIKVAPTMFICKSSKALDFLDNGWDSRRTGGIISVLQKKSIICKYVINSQNFITTFHYTRYHQVNGNQVPLDQDLESDPDNKPFVMEIYLEGQLLTMLNTLSKTSLSQIREDLKYEEIEQIPKDYAFTIDAIKFQEEKRKRLSAKTLSHILFTYLSNHCNSTSILIYEFFQLVKDSFVLSVKDVLK